MDTNNKETTKPTTKEELIQRLEKSHPLSAAARILWKNAALLLLEAASTYLSSLKLYSLLMLFGN